jgi:hypothetical protein
LQTRIPRFADTFSKVLLPDSQPAGNAKPEAPIADLGEGLKQMGLMPDVLARVSGPVPELDDETRKEMEQEDYNLSQRLSPCRENLQIALFSPN